MANHGIARAVMVEIVAEISGNHGGNLEKAERLIHAAAIAGCDYAKFQYYLPKDMPDYYGNRDLYEKLAVPQWWLPRLFRAAKRAGIGLFASVFSVRAARDLMAYDVPYIKLASPESTRLDWGTYEAIASLCKFPHRLIASSGRADYRRMGGLTSRVMYCPPGHPAQINNDDVAFACTSWGYSDHTSGIATPLAVLEGSSIVMLEKHFKLEGDDDCVDAAFSAEPDTMELLCRLVHNNR